MHANNSMARLALLILGVLLAVSMASIPPNYQQIPDVGIYRVSTDKMTWNEAAVECEDDNAGLAIINSRAESAALKKLLTGAPGSGWKAHIGAWDLDGDGSFTTIQNTSLDEAGYNTWKRPPSHAGQPMCGCLWICGRLGEVTCNTKLDFICEINSDN